MSPHPSLHPRSRLTTSLFGTTLLVSFLVVGMPHILPCPRPRLEYSDTDEPHNPRRRRRRKPIADSAGEGETTDLDEKICGERGKAAVREAEDERARREEREEMRRKAHECPVPKPGGWVGEILGFGSKPKDSEGSRGGVSIVKSGNDER